MMPTLAIMATAVDSAATNTDVRASVAASPRTASNPSGPNSARAAGRVAAASPVTRAGAASAIDTIASSVAT